MVTHQELFTPHHTLFNTRYTTGTWTFVPSPTESQTLRAIPPTRPTRIPRTNPDVPHFRSLSQVPALQGIPVGDGVAREGSEEAGFEPVGDAEDEEDQGRDACDAGEDFQAVVFAFVHSK